MKCTAFVTELTDYLDKELTPELKAEIEEHLAKCKNCRVIVDTCKKTIEIYCNSEPAPLPPEVHSRLRAALEQRLRRPRA